MTNQLGDNSPMPFGKYKDENMSDVPAAYLHWLWCLSDTPLKNNPNSIVGDYIRRNLTALQSEYGDAIWD